ncbi:cubilin-like isoform X1 [Frankliniella occidentalis]|uniref:Cubilin-like isoform X1 n=1 Tax=Frankliniella occidentalis TaxID=133901 RepID=A0A9C6X744_FRAOC|nr:cubilin-like isoform X1 [Frankliniella occidentalis]
MVVTLEYRVIPASSLNHPVQRLGVSAGCGGRLTAPYGALHSRNYPQNYGPEDDCVWSIEVAEGHAVELELQDLDIYASLAERRSGNCSGSFLQVIDGADLEGRELLRTCGGGLPDNRTLTSTANKMTVRMKSDGARSSKGFRATYATVCGSTIVTASSGVITSHDAINVQGKNANCSWTVIAEDPADHVTLTIGTLTVSHLDFSEGEEDCSSNNNVEVWEGVDSTGVLLGRYCTGRVPPALTSRGSALHIVMVSPFNSFHGWFSASYSVLSSACGGTFSAERGSFASPGYPASYPPGSDCVWTVTSAPGNLVQMSFSLFNLESSWGCFDDFVEVRKESAMGPLVGVYCGDERPSNLTAAHTLWVKFRSNAQGTAPGFLADFALGTSTRKWKRAGYFPMGHVCNFCHDALHSAREPGHHRPQRRDRVPSLPLAVRPERRLRVARHRRHEEGRHPRREEPQHGPLWRRRLRRRLSGDPRRLRRHDAAAVQGLRRGAAQGRHHHVQRGLRPAAQLPHPPRHHLPAGLARGGPTRRERDDGRGRRQQLQLHDPPAGGRQRQRVEPGLPGRLRQQRELHLGPRHGPGLAPGRALQGHGPRGHGRVLQRPGRGGERRARRPRVEDALQAVPAQRHVQRLVLHHQLHAPQLRLGLGHERHGLRRHGVLG